MTDNQELPSKVEALLYWRDKDIDPNASFTRDAYYEAVDIVKAMQKQLTATQQALDSAVEALEKIQKTNDFHGFADFTALRALKNLKRTDSLQRIEEAQKELSDV